MTPITPRPLLHKVIIEKQIRNINRLTSEFGIVCQRASVLVFLMLKGYGQR